MVISSPLSSNLLVRTAKDTTKKTIGIRKILFGNIEKKKNISNSINIFRRRRIDFEKRSLIKDRLLAPVLVTRDKGPRTLALTDTSKSITDRLLGFIGYLSAGWILSNMPTWIAIGKQFTKRLITAGGILRNYGDESMRVMSGISKVFTSALENISKFDFTDDSNLVKSSLNDLKLEIDSLGNGLKQAFDVMLQPFNGIPAPGTIQPDQPTTESSPPSGKRGDYGAPGEGAVKRYAASKGYSPEFTAGLLATINKESSFNPYAKGDSGSSYGLFQFQGTRRTSFLNYLAANGIPNPIALFQKPDGPTAKKYRNQVFGLTLEYMMEREQGTQIVRDYRNSSDLETIMGGFEDIEVYEGSQTRLPRNRRNNPKYNERLNAAKAYLKSGISTQTPSIPSRPSQPSLRNFAPVSGTSGSVIYNGRFGSRVSVPYSPFRPGSGATITSVMGSRRGHGHTGYDLAANSGTPLYAYFPGKVTHIGLEGSYNDGGYGNWVIWKDDIYGAYHFFGHMLKRPEVRVGDKVQQGTLLGYVGSTGRSDGPHLHWEISNTPPTSMGNFTSRQEVGSWLRSHPLRTSQSTQISSNLVPFNPLIPPPSSFDSTTQVTQVAMGTNSSLREVSNRITQQRRGQQLIIIDDVSNSNAVAQVVTSDNGNTFNGSQTHHSEVLNKYNKNRLLLELA